MAYFFVFIAQKASSCLIFNEKSFLSAFRTAFCSPGRDPDTSAPCAGRCTLFESHHLSPNKKTPTQVTSAAFDIPTGWHPRANESPTGAFIALPLRGRAALFESHHLSPNKKTPTQVTSAAFDIPTGWHPRANESPTGAFIALPLRGRAALFESHHLSPNKKTPTQVGVFSGGDGGIRTHVPD